MPGRGMSDGRGLLPVSFLCMFFCVVCVVFDKGEIGSVRRMNGRGDQHRAERQCGDLTRVCEIRVWDCCCFGASLGNNVASACHPQRLQYSYRNVRVFVLLSTTSTGEREMLYCTVQSSTQHYRMHWTVYVYVCMLILLTSYGTSIRLPAGTVIPSRPIWLEKKKKGLSAYEYRGRNSRVSSRTTLCSPPLHHVCIRGAM